MGQIDVGDAAVILEVMQDPTVDAVELDPLHLLEHSKISSVYEIILQSATRGAKTRLPMAGCFACRPRAPKMLLMMPSLSETAS